jgi:hypothetical protein
MRQRALAGGADKDFGSQSEADLTVEKAVVDSTKSKRAALQLYASTCKKTGCRREKWDHAVDLLMVD